MTTLHDRLQRAVTERLELARKATPGPWAGGAEEVAPGDSKFRVSILELRRTPGQLVSYHWADLDHEADSAFIAANDPATVIRQCEVDLRRLERHRPQPGYYERSAPSCRACADVDHDEYQPWPCPEVEDLALVYGIDEGGET